MPSLSRSYGIAGLILLVLASAGLAQDLSPTSFLQRNTASTAGVSVGAAAPITLHTSLQVTEEYNSNVTLSGGFEGAPAPGLGTGSKSQSDEISEVQVTLGGQWAPTRESQINLAFGVGYQNYAHHPDLDGVTMDVPSNVSYTFYTEDVKWNFHDSLSVSNNPSTEPELSGVSSYQEVANTAGLDAAWAVGSQLTLAAGFDYGYSYTSVTSSGEGGGSVTPEYFSYSLNLGAIYDLSPAVEVGLGSAVADTSYTSNSGTDSVTYSLGPFVHANLTPVTEVFLTGGLQTINVSSNNDGWFATLGVTNRPNRIYSQTLNASRSLELGIISDTYTLDSVQYAGSLELRRDMSLTGNVFYEHGQEGGGLVQETFDNYGGGLGVQMQLSRSISATIDWQYQDKQSDIKGRSYNQTIASLGLSWLF
jgi:hypothetical protein